MPATAEATRYCEDCRFYSAPAISASFSDARCSRPRAMQPVEMVARAAKKPDAFCDMQRGGAGLNDCGHNAQWFEPKPSISAEAA